MDTKDQDWIANNLTDEMATPDGEGNDFKGMIFMSTDGKLTASAEGVTPAQRKKMLIWAKEVHSRLLQSYGTKQESAVKAYKKVEGEASSFICPIDGVPFEEKAGKFGTFWSHYVGQGADGKPIYHNKKD